jgi:hypothetical protein
MTMKKPNLTLIPQTTDHSTDSEFHESLEEDLKSMLRAIEGEETHIPVTFILRLGNQKIPLGSIDRYSLETPSDTFMRFFCRNDINEKPGKAFWSSVLAACLVEPIALAEDLTKSLRNLAIGKYEDSLDIICEAVAVICMLVMIGAELLSECEGKRVLLCRHSQKTGVWEGEKSVLSYFGPWMKK